MCAQRSPETSQGTVNIALANENGIVLLTDSLQSSQNAPANPVFSPKLFQLDEKTVCSIAGFATEKGWFTPQLNTDVAGIITNFRDELARQPVPELDAKIQAIGYLTGFYIDLIANRAEALGYRDRTIKTYMFEVIAAGYDADGQPKIEKLTINPVVQNRADGKNFWSHTIALEKPPLGRELVPVLGGIPIVSQKVLDDPRDFDSDVVRRYALAKQQDGGRSLTLDEMESLASYMAAQSAKRYPVYVGGADQVAVLAGGKIAKFTHPNFPDPPRPLTFSVMTGIQMMGGVPFFSRGDAHFVLIRSSFVGVRYPGLQLDGNFFYGCEVRDSIVSYGGELTDFGPTNTVVNSFLLPGITSAEDTQKILTRYKWLDQPPVIPQNNEAPAER